MNLLFVKKLYPALALATIALTALSGGALASATNTSPVTPSTPSARHPGNYYSQCHFECAPLNGGPFNNGTGSYDKCMSDCLKRRH